MPPPWRVEVWDPTLKRWQAVYLGRGAAAAGEAAAAAAAAKVAGLEATAGNDATEVASAPSTVATKAAMLQDPSKSTTRHTGVFAYNP